MQESLSNFLGELRSGLRFRWYGLIVAWVICVVGWLQVLMMDDVYEGRARVFVDTTTVLERVLGDQINIPDIEGQINYIREALLGRVQLERVLTGLNMASVDDEVADIERKVAELRDQIEIESSGGDWNSPDTFYSITFQDSDRDTAGRVVETLVDTFVESTLGENRRSGETAERFLEARVSEYEERLAVAEEALATFKRENANRLPGAEGDYYDRMRTESDELDSANRELRLLESKRLQLEQQLSNQTSVVNDGDGRELPANSIDARIRDYQSQLDLSLLQYTERHPDIVALRETLDLLKRQRAEQLAALGIDDVEVELFTLGANPVHQAIQIELNNTNVSIAELSADVEDRRRRLTELQGLITELPQVEAQLVQLNRDYDVIYEQYLSLVRSRETQGLTIKATGTDQADFRIIDPPMATLTPVGPPRLAYYFLIFVGSMGIAAGLCFYCAQLWPVFGNVRSLRNHIELPVLGAVSHAWQERQTAELHRSTFRFATAFGLLVICLAGLVGTELMTSGLGAITGEIS